MTKSKIEENFNTQLKLAGYCNKTQYIREAMVLPPRKWRFDFAFPQIYVYIEIEGLCHGKGRHQTIDGYTKDCDKYNSATLNGWIGLRFTQKHIKDLSGIYTTIELLETMNFKPAFGSKL